MSTVVNMHQVTFHHHRNHHHRHYNVDYEQNKSVQSTSDDTSLSSESGDELSKLGRVDYDDDDGDYDDHINIDGDDGDYDYDAELLPE